MCLAIALAELPQEIRNRQMPNPENGQTESILRLLRKSGSAAFVSFCNVCVELSQSRVSEGSQSSTIG